MPLFKKYDDHDTVMGIWKMSESLHELECLYKVKEHEAETYNSFRNDRRRKEWMTVRILLRELIGPEPSIEYMESGKPFLRGSKMFISITHTIGYVGVRLGIQPVALDMEYMSNRVLNLIPRFVSPKEMVYISEENKVTTALLTWSAKETLFKRFDISDVLFDEHLSVRSLYVNGRNGVFTGCVNKEEFYAEVKLTFELFPNFVLVYC